jgi:hypothetical protein
MAEGRKVDVGDAVGADYVTVTIQISDMAYRRKNCLM